jgi:ferredoxin-nitrate reductase
MADRIADPWGTRTPHARGADWPVRVDQYIEPGIDEGAVEWVQSTCVLCSNGCALDIAVADGRMAGVRGRGVDRVNHGRLGPKGLFGWQANNAPDRLLRPLIRTGGELVETDWDTALGRVAERARKSLDERGSGALGFYTTGQLFIEDYYPLVVLARGGIGTNHLDGNTRLCTATAGTALKETFGCDGQPGSYTDVEHADTFFHVGINMAETQTVLWARHLDRLHGPDRPRLVVIDPRLTPAAREADVHLAVKPGTNVALLNAILHELIAHAWIDEDWIEAHTVGFPALEETVSRYPPATAAETCGVPAADISRAAELIGNAEALLSFVLQGVYQSHGATAAACQVNNINLVRGMLGRPGAGILQMNGQPTAQNTRETGANGDLPGFRNWQNDDHVRELAELWNVDELQIPHWGPPTHAMQIFRYAEQGSIDFLWIIGTNPAVSLPELQRVRSILEQERLFVVVSDAFLSETARLADVVLPAALWGDKTGTFTNADRTVHLSEQAVEPPGEAKADGEIFRMFAERLGLTDKDGAPLIKWRTREETFEAWKACSRGRPCDYSGITYEKLRGGSGIQWPCNEAAPDGTERLYTDGVFSAGATVCEDFGHELQTGASFTQAEYSVLNPDGKAMLKPAEWTPPHEEVRKEYPLLLTTGRTVYHFHTRTKTARAPQLQAAAPDVWVELSPMDARELGIGEGDLVAVETPRGEIRAPARISGVREGVVFVPFHYGYWDEDAAAPNGDGPRAANELTMTIWDPVSKQPAFKTAAARVRKLADAEQPSPAPTIGAAAPAELDQAPTQGGPDAEAAEVTA